MKNSGIYKIVNIVNGKILIGQTKNLNKRWNGHKSLLRRGKHENPHLQNAWDKYGEQNFKFEIILPCPVSDLNSKEIELIKKYNSTDQNIGYNIMDGGNRPNFSKETRLKMSKSGRGRVFSEEHKRKISEANKGKKISNESKRKMSKAKKGDKCYCFGKHFSEEHRKKIGDAIRGEKHYLFGRHHSEETKIKMSKSRSGNKNPNFGKHMSDEQKEKLRKYHTGRKHSEETKEKMRESRLRYLQYK